MMIDNDVGRVKHLLSKNTAYSEAKLRVFTGPISGIEAIELKEGRSTNNEVAAWDVVTLL